MKCLLWYPSFSSFVSCSKNKSTDGLLGLSQFQFHQSPVSQERFGLARGGLHGQRSASVAYSHTVLHLQPHRASPTATPCFTYSHTVLHRASPTATPCFTVLHLQPHRASPTATPCFTYSHTVLHLQPHRASPEPSDPLLCPVSISRDVVQGLDFGRTYNTRFSGLKARGRPRRPGLTESKRHPSCPGILTCSRPLRDKSDTAYAISYHTRSKLILVHLYKNFQSILKLCSLCSVG